MSAKIAIPDDEIRAAVENRIPAKRLAEKYGCAESTIHMKAYALGLRFASRSSYDPAIHAGAAAGKNAIQIAGELGVDPNNLRDRVRKLGVKLPPAPRGANWHSEAVRLNDRGYDLQLIADATGQTPSAVQNVLRAHGRRRNDPRQIDASRVSRANDSELVEPWEIPNPNEDMGDESDEWPASVPAPTLPDELAVPALVISGGELRDSVVHGGKIVHRCDDFVDAMRWARAQKPPCFVVRERDYVALCRTEAPRKRAKTMALFGE